MAVRNGRNEKAEFVPRQPYDNSMSAGRKLGLYRSPEIPMENTIRPSALLQHDMRWHALQMAIALIHQIYAAAWRPAGGEYRRRLAERGFHSQYKSSLYQCRLFPPAA